MIKMTKKQIKELLEMKKDAQRQLDDILEMEKVVTDRSFLERLNSVKQMVIESAKTYNTGILDQLKNNYDYEVPDYLYIQI